MADHDDLSVFAVEDEEAGRSIIYYDASAKQEKGSADMTHNQHRSDFRQSVMFEPLEKHSAFHLFKQSFTANRCMIALSVALSLLVTIFLVVCIGFGIEMVRINSEITALNKTLSAQQASFINQSFSVRVDQLQDSTSTSFQSLSAELSSLEADFLRVRDGRFHHFPLPSCASLSPSSPSGYYWVRASDNSAAWVYCNVSHTCGNIIGGWTKVYKLDMTRKTHNCPVGLREQSANGLRTCLRTAEVNCSSVTLPTSSLNYTAVCGRVKAYHYGSPDAFISTLLEENFVDGMTFSHGHPRTHIWTFVIALSEVRTSSFRGYCSCIAPQRARPALDFIPPFLGNDYFCDTGREYRLAGAMWYTQNPLWDGAGCGQHNNCCSFGNPPWFYKQLPKLTTDDIEMRVCMTDRPAYEDVGIEAVDIYVR